MPISPSSASFGTSSRGNAAPRPTPSRAGAISASANSRTLRRKQLLIVGQPDSPSATPIVSFGYATRRASLRIRRRTARLDGSPHAFADATIFIGTQTTPSSRRPSGFAVGAGLLIVGFEFEYREPSEDLADAAPSLRTGMGNVLIQTPFAIAGFQPYFTTGGGGYRETLGTRQETNFGVNTGGGVKISLIGPLRARVRLPCVQTERQPAAFERAPASKMTRS